MFGELLEYNKFEKTRIIGARALQLAYGAPPLIKIPKGTVDPLVVAELEFNQGIVPITIITDKRAGSKK